MLKPKYRSLAEAVGDFNSLLGKLDERHPRDPHVLDKKTKALKELDEEIAKVEDQLNRHTHPTSTGSTSLPKPVLEHAPLSRYSSNRSAMQSFRMLAGLDERPSMPWDLGAAGSTRHVVGELSRVGLVSEDAAQEAPVASEPNHVAYGKKISKHALARSYFFRHNRHEMPSKAKLKSHEQLAHHHGQVVGELGKLANAATKRGDRHGAIALKHMQRMHHEIGTLHTQKKHHRMFESTDGTSVDLTLMEQWPAIARSVGQYSLGNVSEWKKSKPVVADDDECMEYEEEYEDESA